MQTYRILLFFFALVVSASVAAPIPSPADTPAGPTELSAGQSESELKLKEQADALRHQLEAAIRPQAGEIVFWSGQKSNGKSVSKDARKFAEKHGKTLIQYFLSKEGIKMPYYQKSPIAEEVWKYASELLATRSHGSIDAFLGSIRRPGNVYDTIEKPALLANKGVTKLTEHDPETGHSTVVKGG